MARRRLSRQQQQRIRAAQAAHAVSGDIHQGLVITHQGGQVIVELDRDITVECKIKSNLGTLVCGDRVGIETTEREERRVVAILERENLLQRVDGFGQERAVAANISQLIVCLAVVPEPNLYLLDQYLLSAEQAGIDACILLNKIDLAPEAIDPFGLEAIYQPLHYPVLRTSVTSGQGMQQFKARLGDRVSVLSGVSGVGKSSLTSWLLPDEKIKIADISAANAEGRHTTRGSRLYHLEDGGDLIDTPGVRGFSPFINRERALGDGFREISRFGADCRFHNCSHRNEPNCAVVAAVDRGEIHPQRFQNYLKLLQQSDEV